MTSPNHYKLNRSPPQREALRHLEAFLEQADQAMEAQVRTLEDTVARLNDDGVRSPLSGPAAAQQ